MEGVSKRQKIPKIVGCVSACKRAFNLPGFAFGGFGFCFGGFPLIFGKRQKGHLPANLRFFSSVPQEALSSKHYFLLVCRLRLHLRRLFFLFFFLFCLPFQNGIFAFSFSSSTPFGKTCLCFLLNSSFLFPLSFPIFASYLETNFPEIPFQTQVAFMFVCLAILLVFCVFLF